MKDKVPDAEVEKMAHTLIRNLQSRELTFPQKMSLLQSVMIAIQSDHLNRQSDQVPDVLIKTYTFGNQLQCEMLVAGLTGKSKILGELFLDMVQKYRMNGTV